jgi:nitrous oxidase accessory protein NosD
MAKAWVSRIGVALVCGLLSSAASAAHARVRRVPDRYPTIQAAVDASSPGDVVDVAPGSYCGATVTTAVTLMGHGRATIVGCPEGPTISGELRAGFYLAGADGASAAGGTRIDGFTFDGRGIAADNLAPLALGVFARFASDVRVENNVFLGTVQAITNTAGDGWCIAGNRIEGLTLFDCTGALCAGGDGIVIQLARDTIAAAGGPGAPVNRPEHNVVVGNRVSGAIPDGFGDFSMAGIFVFAADDTAVEHNEVSIPDNPTADATGDGVLVSNVCCGVPAVVPGARHTVVLFNNGRDSQFGVVVEGSGGDNTGGLVLFGNSGPVMVEGTLVDDHHPRRPMAARRFIGRRTVF